MILWLQGLHFEFTRMVTLMTEPSLFSTEHIELVGMILFPLGTGLGYLIWSQAQMALKVNLMFDWFVNDGHEITGGDKYSYLKKKRS